MSGKDGRAALYGNLLRSAGLRLWPGWRVPLEPALEARRQTRRSSDLRAATMSEDRPSWMPRSSRRRNGWQTCKSGWRFQTRGCLEGFIADDVGLEEIMDEHVRGVKVWDLPLRPFHGTLVIVIALGFLSSEEDSRSGNRLSNLPVPCGVRAPQCRVIRASRWRRSSDQGSAGS